MLFDFAEEAGAIFALEKVCREAAIQGFAGRGQAGRLFCNVHPRTLLDPAFTPGETRRLLDKYGMEPRNVVLEITERHSVKDFNLFHRTLDHYRAAGYGVAVDDVGTGYSGLASIAEIRPDFIKLDMSLVRGIDANPVKRALIETLLTYADKVGCRMVAEGIETEAELFCLIRLGVHFGQGFFLAGRRRRPKPCPTRSGPPWPPEPAWSRADSSAPRPSTTWPTAPRWWTPRLRWGRSSSSSTPTAWPMPWPWCATAGPRAWS
jgi:EAL domain-containing protein (putative c-di-GMP-specific phosphodiesterase class I)